MSSSKSILLNTIITYSRSLLGAFLAIFSSRWVLNSLGESDFGLYTLIGVIISFVTFLNSTLSVSASRYFAYVDNKGKEEVNRWFNVSFCIHFFFPLILLCVGYPVGLFFIKNVLQIAKSQINDACVVFGLSLIAAFFSMISVPFIAMYTAKQRFLDLAFWGIIQSLLLFLSAYILIFWEDNRLILYTSFVVLSTICVQIIQMGRAFYLFSECKLHFSYFFNKNRSCHLLGYSFWNFWGNFGHLVRTQGNAILVNLFFGTQGNAALGIGNQVSNQTNVLATSLSTVVTPAIVQNEGAGNRKEAVRLSYLTAKLGIILILLLTIPILVEADNILNIWLIQVPKYSVGICQLMIIMFMIEKSTMGQYALLQAIGRIKRVELSTGIFYSLTILLAYLLIIDNKGIYSIGYACVFMMLISRFFIVFDVKRYFNIPIKNWLNIIIFPYLIITFWALGISYIVSNLFIPSLFRIFLNIIVNFVVVIGTSYFLLLNRQEKNECVELIRKNILRNKNLI